MTGKILLTYASMTGSTQGVSEAIGKTLTELGADVDVISMSEREQYNNDKQYFTWRCMVLNVEGLPASPFEAVLNDQDF